MPEQLRHSLHSWSPLGSNFVTLNGLVLFVYQLFPTHVSICKEIRLCYQATQAHPGALNTDPLSVTQATPTSLETPLRPQLRRVCVCFGFARPPANPLLITSFYPHFPKMPHTPLLSLVKSFITNPSEFMPHIKSSMSLGGRADHQILYVIFAFRTHNPSSSHTVEQVRSVPADYAGRTNNVFNLLRENCLAFWKVDS